MGFILHVFILLWMFLEFLIWGLARSMGSAV